MKITTDDIIRSCQNLACTLNGRLEEAMSVARPEEEPVLCELTVKAHELSLSLSQFSERLRSFRPEPAARATKRPASPKASRRAR